jgi:hypothetical protein
MRWKGRIRGKEVLDRKIEETAEIQGAGVFPVQQVRASAGVPSQVRYVSHLFPRARSRGEDSGHYQGELVDLRRMTSQKNLR